MRHMLQRCMLLQRMRATTRMEGLLRPSVCEQAGHLADRYTRNEIQRRDAILEAVSFASERFLEGSGWHDGIQDVLARLGEAAAVSRAYLFEHPPGCHGRVVC